MSNNLTKKQIGIVDVGVLNTRYCWLMKKGEEMPVGIITFADARELLWIEDELHRRLIMFIGHDFYPPDHIESDIKSGVRQFFDKQDGKLNLKITITSSIGTKITVFTAKVDTRSEADLLACKKIRELGLKKATYKIS